MVLAPVASSCLWDLVAALGDYLEAVVYGDYQLFNHRREGSFRNNNSAELQGKESLFLTDS